MKIGKMMLTLSFLVLTLGFISNVNAQIVEQGGPTINVDGNDVTVTLHLFNPVSTSTGDVLVELQLREQHWPLATIGSQTICNPNYPWNVHRIINLNGGEFSNVELTATRDDGTYHLYLVSVDKCCVDQLGNVVTPACVDKTPYGLYGRFISTVTIGDAPPTSPSPFQFLINNWIYILVVVILIIVGAVLMASDGGKKKNGRGKK